MPRSSARMSCAMEPLERAGAQEIPSNLITSVAHLLIAGVEHSGWRQISRACFGWMLFSRELTGGDAISAVAMKYRRACVYSEIFQFLYGPSLNQPERGTLPRTKECCSMESYVAIAEANVRSVSVCHVLHSYAAVGASRAF